MTETIERTCVNGLSPDALVRVPTEAEFEGRDFMRSKDLKQIGDALVRTERFGLSAIALYEAQVEYLWVNKQKKKAGKAVLGACFKESGRSKFYSNRDYTIEIYAGSLRDFKFTHWQLQALIDHELRHIKITVDEETDAVTFGIVGHDAELFHAELEHYGLWESGLELTAEAFRQVPLFGAESTADHLQKLHDLGATISQGGREIKTEDDMRAAMKRSYAAAGIVTDEEGPSRMVPPLPTVESVTGQVVNGISAGMASRTRKSQVSNVTADQADALRLAEATP